MKRRTSQLVHLFIRAWAWFDWCFVPRDFVRVTIDGASCVLSPVDACALVSTLEQGSQFTVKNVRMRVCSFEAMEEFNGF
jgi:phosphatidylserine decarboxylase